MKKLLAFSFCFVFLVLAADYLASLAPANMLHIGPLAVSWGTPLIGLVLALRDTIQSNYGIKTSYMVVLVTAVASVLFAWAGGTTWTIILASALAFLVSETVDQLVYTWTKGKQSWRIFASTFVSGPIDSLIFVSLTFGFSMEFVLAQWLVKSIACFAYVLTRQAFVTRQSKTLKTSVNTTS